MAGHARGHADPRAHPPRSQPVPSISFATCRPRTARQLIVHGGAPLSAGSCLRQQERRASHLCATLLTRQPVHLRGVSDITDVRKILAVFEEIGSEVHADFERGIVGILTATRTST